MSRLVLLMLWGCASSVEPVPPTQVQSAATITPVGTPQAPVVQNYDFELGRMDLWIERHSAAAKSAPTAPKNWVALTDAHLERARLSGLATDREHAWSAFRTAEKLSPGTPTVLRLHARLLQGDHHFRKALTELGKIPEPTDADLGLMASIRFELGEYDAAWTELNRLVKKGETSALARLAACEWKLGRFESAKGRYAEAAEQYHGRRKWPVAWHHLMLGLMELDRDNLDAAMVHYKAADNALPGWWLVEEHMAEVALLQGQPERALPLYERAVAQTGSPELLSALAETHRALGDDAEARALQDRAVAAFLREATTSDVIGGHGLEMYVGLGIAPAKALSMARQNVQNRPNGSSKLLLADALEADGQVDEALRVRQDVAASGWWVPRPSAGER